jgi:hypothetical protein
MRALAPGFLPFVSGQIYMIWTMLTGRLQYVDYQLLVLVEVVIVHASLLLFNRREPLGARLSRLAIVALVIVPALLFFVAILASPALAPETTSSPWALVGELLSRMGGEGLRTNLCYLGITFGFALAQAFASPDFRGWWYLNVVTRNQTSVAALITSLILLGPVLVVLGKMAALSSSVTNGALVVLLIVLRFAFAMRSEYLLMTRPVDAYAEFAEPRSRSQGRSSVL